MDSYDPGDPIRLIGTFQNSSGAPTTPGAVTLSIVPPVQFRARVPGTLEYTLASGVQVAAAGSVYYDILPLPGTWGVWQYSYVGSGPYAAFAGQFFVRQGP